MTDSNNSNMSAKTSFSWKRKRCKNVSNLLPATFSENDDINEPLIEDWRSLTKKSKHGEHGVLEDRIAKSTRLKNEGIALAELQKFWESIRKWNEAIQLTPDDDILHEMKAQEKRFSHYIMQAMLHLIMQLPFGVKEPLGSHSVSKHCETSCTKVLLELDEIFPAIQEAEMAVSLNPRCPNSFQTLGRAQIAIGEIEMAIISFSKALHIKPDSEEIRDEDLGRAIDLTKERNKRQKNNETV